MKNCVFVVVLLALLTDPASAQTYVYVADSTLPSIASLSIANARAFFEALTLEGWRGEVASRIVKEIASRLCISPHTVNDHTRRIYDKLRVHGRRQAVKRAVELGLVDRGMSPA